MSEELITVPTRPPGDRTNAAASTEFVVINGVFGNLANVPGTLDYRPALLSLIAQGFKYIYIGDGTFPFSSTTIASPVTLLFSPLAIITPVDNTVSPVFNITAPNVTFTNAHFLGTYQLVTNGGFGASVDVPLIGSSLDNPPIIWFGGSGYLSGGSGSFIYNVTDNGGTGGQITFTVTNGVITAANTTAGGIGYSSSVQTRLLFTPSGGTGGSVLVSVDEATGAFILPNVGNGTVTCTVKAGGTGYLGGGTGVLVYDVTQGGGSGGQITFNVVAGVLISGIVTTAGANYVPNVGTVPIGSAYPAQWLLATSVDSFTVQGCNFNGGSQATVANLCTNFHFINNEVGPLYTNGIGVNVISNSNFWIEDNYIHDVYGAPHNGAGIRITGTTNAQTLDGVISRNNVQNGNHANGIDANCSAMWRVFYSGNKITANQFVGIQIKQGVGSLLPIASRGVRDVTFIGNIIECTADGVIGFHFQQNRGEPYEIQLDRSNIVRHTPNNHSDLGAIGLQFIAPTTVAGGPVAKSNFSPTIIDSSLAIKIIGKSQSIHCAPLCYGVRRGITTGGGALSPISAIDLSGACVHATEFGALLSANPIERLVMNGATLVVEGASLSYTNGISINAPGSGYTTGTFPLYVAGSGIGGQLNLTVVAGALSGTPAVLCAGYNYLGGGSGTFVVSIYNPYYQDIEPTPGTVTVTVTNGQIVSAVITTAGSGYLAQSGSAGTFMPVLPEGVIATATFAGGICTAVTMTNGGTQFYDVNHTVTVDPAAGGSGATFILALGVSIGLQLGNVVGGVISNCYIQGNSEAINITAGTVGIEQVGNLLQSRLQRPVLAAAGTFAYTNLSTLVSPASPAVLIIASNAVVISRDLHRLQPSSGTTDTLKTVTGFLADGQLVTFAAHADTDVITLDATGNMILGAATRVLDKRADAIQLQWREDLQKLVEIAFANNA